MTVFDVFLLDSDFKIERPTRYYRQGLHLLRDGGDDDDEKKSGNGKGKEVERSPPRQHGGNNADNPHLTPPADADCISTLGSIRSKISKVFKRNKVPDMEVPSRPSGSGSGGPPRVSTDDTASTASTVSSRSERPPTPMLDPSTNTNPLLDADENQDHPNPSKKRNRDEVSKHTFYIKNSQMKLKINAKNERQMLQWIAALEKASSTCHFTRRSRFDSFAPIRLNVAAQWLVDGVRDFPRFIPSPNSRISYMTSAIISGTFLVLFCSRKSRFISTIGGYLRVSQCAACSWFVSDTSEPVVELQLRRPGKERYRLDRLLQRKAQEGVKIYIIL